VPSRLRLAERVGKALRFSPQGRSVRVWTRSRPGEEDAEIVTGKVVEVRSGAAVVEFDRPARVEDRELTRIRAVPREPGWGLEALWFAFIPIDAFPADEGERVGRWWMRLGRGR
jgi:hypothetical protein